MLGKRGVTSFMVSNGLFQLGAVIMGDDANAFFKVSKATTHVSSSSKATFYCSNLQKGLEI